MGSSSWQLLGGRQNCYIKSSFESGIHIDFESGIYIDFDQYLFLQLFQSRIQN